MDKSKKEFLDKLKARFEFLKEERQLYESDWKDVQRYVASSLFDWNNSNNKKPERPPRFTSRPTNYLKTLKSGMTGYSISPNIAWMKLGLENYNVINNYGVKDWLEAVEDVLYAEFNRSNLYSQASKFIEFAATYGHAVMLIDEQMSDGRLRFTTINPQEVYLGINEYDEVDTVFRRFAMTLENAVEFFGLENLSDTHQLEFKETKNWYNKITIIHAVYKRKEHEEKSMSSKEMPYASVYYEENAEDSIIMESGYNDFPYAVFIWDRYNGSAYGESPSINALCDIKTLNIIDESGLKITQKSADPPLNVPEDMKENENVVPNGYNYYSKPEMMIKPINTGENFGIVLESKKEIEDRVKDWFLVDFFLALMRERASNITATYVMELQGEKAATLSDIVVNINSPLTKIVQRGFNIVLKQRKLPQPPQVLMGSGAEMKVDFMGPLAQAQKKYLESQGISQGINLIGTIVQLSPESLDVIDFDETLKQGLSGMGFSQIAIREDEDIEAIRNQRAQQQAQMMQQQQAMEQQKNLMNNYGKLNEPVKPGSAIDEINKEAAAAGGGGFYQ